MSGEAPIFNVHWTIGHCVASLNTAFWFAVPATAQSPTFVARDQSLKGVQNRCPRGPAKVTFRCSALRLAQCLYTHKGCLLLPTVARLNLDSSSVRLDRNPSC
jgi:hypothetical protein